MERTEPSPSGDEATLLSGFLDWFRETIALKTDGLDAAGLAAAHPPSTMTLGGMLAHLAFVEDYWVGHILLGRPPSPPWDTAPWDTDADWDWHMAADRTPEQLRQLWRSTVERSRADFPYDDLDLDAALPRGEVRHTARWVLVHLIEEYGRHAGHADLIREAVDGSVGE